MAACRKLVVTGATGKQGGATIRALLNKPTQSFEIYAVTRNAKSPSAQALASLPGVKVVQGDFHDPVAIFQQIKQPWGLFSMTMPMNHKTEAKQGIAMTDAAIQAGVQHIVFTATDRGDKGDEDPTPIPHFASKFAIEQDIIQRNRESSTTYTLLRPVAFMDNLRDDFLGRSFVSLWRLNGHDSRLQLVATSDVGKVAAEAFLNSESEEYRNKAISLAGDEISVTEAAEIFRQEVGKEIGFTSAIVARTLKWVLYSHLGIMFDWFRTNGFRADVPGLRKRYPFLKDFRRFLHEDSPWKKA